MYKILDKIEIFANTGIIYNNNDVLTFYNNMFPLTTKTDCEFLMKHAKQYCKIPIKCNIDNYNKNLIVTEYYNYYDKYHYYITPNNIIINFVSDQQKYKLFIEYICIYFDIHNLQISIGYYKYNIIYL